MYNLHCHSLLSDGVLLPSEVAMRYLSKGYKAIAITDHADYSTIRTYIPAIIEFCKNWPKSVGITVLPGIELTHLPPEQFQPLVRYSRGHGIKVVIGHGESPVEPVIKGTNRAAILAGVDILAHPGSITEEDAQLAKEKGVFLEITTRRGHSTANKHVIDIAAKSGTKLILNQDSHAPDDILTPPQMADFARLEGLSEAQYQDITRNTAEFLKKIS